MNSLVQTVLLRLVWYRWNKFSTKVIAGISDLGANKIPGVVGDEEFWWESM